MSYLFKKAWLAFGLAVLGPDLSAASLKPASLAVGKNLQASATVVLSEPTPAGGLEITLTSDDPSRVLFANRPDVAGAASLKITVRPDFKESPEFWVQAHADSGEVSYSASTPGFTTGKGTVTLTPSAIVMVGPYQAPEFRTTSRGQLSKMTLYTVRLDASLKYVEQQSLAGGVSVDVDVTSSDKSVGVIVKSPIRIEGGMQGGAADFKPVGPGNTSLAASVPAGFRASIDHGATRAVVNVAGMFVTDQVMLGQNLQLGGVVGLGEAAPKEGVKVTLKSSQPGALLLARTAAEVGSESLTVDIPAGEVRAQFFIQALGKSGNVTYTATADGYTSRTGTIVLAPSGVVITPSPYGPPDEAELFRKESTEVPRGFISSLSKKPSMSLVVWTAQLDPVTLRSADITVQPLRAGVTITVDLTSSDPKVGQVSKTVTIAGGADHAGTEFKAQGIGSTVISAATPKGFTTSSNSTSVSAIVRE